MPETARFHGIAVDGSEDTDRTAPTRCAANPLAGPTKTTPAPYDILHLSSYDRALEDVERYLGSRGAMPCRALAET